MYTKFVKVNAVLGVSEGESVALGCHSQFQGQQSMIFLVFIEPVD